MNDVPNWTATIAVENELLHPSETRIAEVFVERNGEQFRYVAQWGQWFHWDGKVWREEPTLLVHNMICDIAKELARDTNRNAEIRSLLKQSTISGAERIARAMRQVAATIDQWNLDPWLLNTPRGVIDLRNGNTRNARPADYMTKISGIAPEANCATPTWDAHLQKIFPGAQDQQEKMIAYQYRVWGYCLTGDVREHVLFFYYGEGRNGKSTTMNVLRFIWGGYAYHAPMEMFTYRKAGHEHPTELADLFGARLVMATETEQGKGWSEARIKHLTGGEPVRARRMRENFWEFPPTHKLLFSGNHRPGLRNTGVAMRSRFHLVPFDVVIPDKEQIKDIDAALQQEAPGILYKMIQGCLAWQRDGLNPPTAVVAASKEYLDAEDTLGLWFEDCVTVGLGQQFTETLYFSYRQWMERAGHVPLRQNAFIEELCRRSTKLGIRREPEKFTVGVGEHSRRGRGFSGIASVSADGCM